MYLDCIKFVLIVPPWNSAKDENRTEYMVDILEWVHQYAYGGDDEGSPHPSLNKTVQVPTDLSHPIELSGDQKTATRGRGAQKARVNSTLLSEKLVGII